MLTNKFKVDFFVKLVKLNYFVHNSHYEPKLPFYALQILVIYVDYLILC